VSDDAGRRRAPREVSELRGVPAPDGEAWPALPAALEPVGPIELLGYDSCRCLPEATGTEKRVLKHGNLFSVTNRLGDIWPPGARDLGAYFDDTRLLSAFRLHVAGAPAVCLSSHQAREGRVQVDLTVTSTRYGGVFGDPVNFVHLRREQVVHEAFAERLVLTNHLVRPLDYWFEHEFHNDFADVFEVRGAERRARGTYFRPVVGAQDVRLFYEGLDRVLYEVRLEWSRPPTRLSGDRARFEFSLAPGESLALELHVRARLVLPEGPSPGARRRLVWPDGPAFFPATGLAVPAPACDVAGRTRLLEQDERAWIGRCTRIRTDDETFDAVTGQAVADLGSLVGDCAGRPVVAAGIPWYTAPFGRDALLTGHLALAVNPDLARDALAFLAAHQGTRDDPEREEAPGKILHEVRRGEMARAREVPHSPYFGSVDATPLWLVLLSEYFLWTGDEDFVRAHLPHATAALAWLERASDPALDGLLTYRRAAPAGLRNQGWKDSSDGVSFPDGTPLEPPIALVEVQGYAVDAERRMSELFRRFGDRPRATRLQEQARQRQRRLEQRFWMPEAATYGLAVDRDGTLARTVTSNAGHLLFSGAVSPARAQLVADSTLSPALWTGWGIRTLAAGQPVYNPLSYHNGTVWPHDNALISLGFSRYGLREASSRVLTGLFDAVHHFDGQRLPELFCGLERGHRQFPVHYPVACAPQAWSSAAIFGALTACLGLFPDVPRGLLRVVQPHLPPFLHRIDLRGLRLGRSVLDLRFERAGRGVLVAVPRQEGPPIDVRVELR
jgi:glycogen debranching enzyme